MRDLANMDLPPTPISTRNAAVASSSHGAVKSRAALTRPEMRAAEKRTRALNLLFKEALDKLRAGCASCWGRGFLNWDDHTAAACEEDVGNRGDEDWMAIQSSAFMLDGEMEYCFGCLMPMVCHSCFLSFFLRLTLFNQSKVGGSHAGIFGKGCAHAWIIKSALYSSLANPAAHISLRNCPLLPEDTGTQEDNFRGFREWAVEVSDEAAPYLNLHAGLLWLCLMQKLVTLPAELEDVFAF